MGAKTRTRRTTVGTKWGVHEGEREVVRLRRRSDYTRGGSERYMERWDSDGRPYFLDNVVAPTCLACGLECSCEDQGKHGGHLHGDDDRDLGFMRLCWRCFCVPVGTCPELEEASRRIETVYGPPTTSFVSRFAHSIERTWALSGDQGVSVVLQFSVKRGEKRVWARPRIRGFTGGDLPTEEAMSKAANWALGKMDPLSNDMVTFSDKLDRREWRA
jgi:hypothetical protein